MTEKMRKVMIIAVGIIMLVSFSTLAEGKYPVKITDDLGREIVIEHEPGRIVSLAPSHTETLFALGLGNKVVGVTEYANYPAEAKKIAKVGSIREPSLEKIIKLNPDLVVAAGITPKKIVRKLAELEIKVIGLDAKTIEGVIEDIALIGKAAGQSKEAEKLTSNLTRRKEKVVQKVKENVFADKRPKVFYEVWKKPLRTAGPGTFVDDLIDLAGGVNIAHDAKQKWPQYSFEVLLKEDPDVYLSTTHSWKGKVTKKTIRQRDKFKEIEAIKEGRIHVLDPDIVNRPGPRIVDALEQIAQALHPQLFKEE